MTSRRGVCSSERDGARASSRQMGATVGRGQHTWGFVTVPLLALWLNENRRSAQAPLQAGHS
jgi:hypothetical protein